MKRHNALTKSITTSKTHRNLSFENAKRLIARVDKDYIPNEWKSAEEKSIVDNIMRIGDTKMSEFEALSLFTILGELIPT